MNFDSVHQTARRAIVGWSILGWAAFACLLLNGLFWATLLLDMLAPSSILSPQAIQAALSTVAFALILPLFWSMLLPSSPAGRLLQRQQWATPGYVATTAAAGFLTWLAGTWLRAWWAAQPNVVESGSDFLLMICSLIAGILVPALAWCVTTPEQWIAAIEQARHVKRIEHAMKMEEAAMRAAYARAVALLHADLTNLTIEQRRELAGILGGFARMQQRSMQQIADSWKDMYGVECQLAVIPDQQLLDSYQHVANVLTDGAHSMEVSADFASEVRSLDAPNDRATAFTTAPAVRSFTPHPAAVQAVRPNEDERPNGSVQRTSSGPAADHRTGERPPHERALNTAQRVLDGAWTRRDLEGALSISKTQAHTYMKAWIASGDLISLTEPQDHYEWSES